MKTWKPQLLTLLGVTLAGAALAEPVTVPVTLKNGNAWPLGTGYDSLDQKIKGFCVTNGLGADGKPIDPTRDVIEGSNKLDFERDENAVKSKLSLSGSGRYQTGATTMSLAADFYKASKSNEYRSTFTLVRENFIREAMNQDLRGLIKPYPDAVKYTKTKMDWYNNCGDMFVRARLLSAKLFVNISFSFVSKEEKESFKTKFDLTSAMAEGHLKFDQGAESLSAGNRITVQAYQIGGDTSNLGRTLCAATVVADSKNPDDLKPDPNCDQSSRAIVSCGFGDMTKCSQMFASAVAYGNGNGVGQFGSQIADGKNFSLTELEMAPYDAVKGTFPATPKLPEIKNQRQARVDAEALYNKQWELFTRAEALWLGRAPRLSSEQRDDMETFKAELFENAKKLADAVDVCYDKGVDECVAKTKAATPKAKRAGADWETEQNQFIQDHSVAVSYVQFCDIADDSHRSTKRTVETLREYIRLHTRKEKYESIEKGDRCLNEAGFLEALTELTLPAAKDSLHPDVADLGPIGALKRLTKLALPGQGILDVKPLAGLANLEELTLGDNQIADASPLAKLGNLRKLDLQNNELTTFRSGFCEISQSQYPPPNKLPKSLSK